MPRVHHLLLTRFNVRHPELEGDAESRGLEQNWLRHRTPLFESLCAPSVAGQTERNFKWLVFVHPDTPRDFLVRIQAAIAGARGTLVRVPEASPDSVLEHIGSVSTGDIVLTSRLDNDDALSRSHVERLQRASGPLPFAANFPWGYQLRRDGTVRLSRHLSNPFIGYFERVGSVPLQTVWGFNHRQLPPHAALIQLGRSPAWLVSIHDRNIANPQRSGLIVPRRVVLERFSVAPEVVADPSLGQIGVSLVREGAAVLARRVRRLAGK